MVTDLISVTQILIKLLKNYEVGEKTVYNKHRGIVLNKEGRQLKRFYVFIYGCMQLRYQ